VADLETKIRVASFRAALRAFLHRHEQISRAGGLTPQRYLLLLMIGGAPDGSERARFTDVADRLLLDRTTVTELVARAEREGLLTREPSEADRRVVYLRLTAEGERRLSAVIDATESERRALAGAFSELRRTLRAV
jgi:DNA-binding MarR family transcriptional regulator